MGHDRLPRQNPAGHHPVLRDDTRHRAWQGCGHRARHTWLRCPQSLTQQSPTYFIRVGTQSREPTPEELGRLFQQRGTFRAELQPVSGAKPSDLDRRRLRDYFARIRQQDVPADDDEAGWQTLLINTEIMTEEGV